MYLRSLHQDPDTWNDLIAPLPGSHLLQTWEWGQIKTRIGWRPCAQTWTDSKGDLAAAALTLIRSVSLARAATPLRLVYTPKGPLLDWENAALRRQVLADLCATARRHGAMAVKVDPEVNLGTGIPGSSSSSDDQLGLTVQQELAEQGWRFSGEQVQYRNTVVLDLQPGEEQLLAGMKQKTRYNIRLAERRGVTLRTGSLDDLPLLYGMYAETALRDGFAIRDEPYYRAVWSRFLQAGMAEPLIAEVESEPVAGLVWFRHAGRAWYLHGMSTLKHREKMPNYFLQWEAIRRAKAAGCRVYDLWGAPDTFQEDDPMWGVFRFKQGFNGSVVRYLGAWDYPVKPLWYRIFTRILPPVLDLMRRRGAARTRQQLNPD